MDTAKRSMVEMRLREAELQLNELLHAGISAGKAAGWLDEARSALSAGNLDLAVQRSEMVISSSQVLLEARDSAFNRISLAATEIANAANYGIDTSRALSFLQEARVAETEGRYSEASAFAEKATSILAENISSQTRKEDYRPEGSRPVHALVRELEQTRSELAAFRVDLSGDEGVQLSNGLSQIAALVEAGRFAEAEATSSWFRTERYLTPFPYPHGLELELLLVAPDGRWLPLKRAEEMVQRSVHQGLASLRHRVSLEGAAGIPRLVRRKLRRLGLEPGDPRHGPASETVAVEYQVGYGAASTAVIGRGHGRAGLPRAIRIATPPCGFAEELEWWAHSLYSTVYDSVAIESGCRLLSAGANPVEPFREDETPGDRHFLFIEDSGERSAAQSSILRHLPELLSSCVNSPVADSAVPPAMPNAGGMMVMQNSGDPFSLRLRAGAAGLAIVEEHPAPRGILEIGPIDPQLSIRARLGIAVLLQSLAAEGVRRSREGGVAPAVDRAALSLNIERALMRGGLLPLEAPGAAPARIADSARNMVLGLRERLLNLRCEQRDWLDVVLLSLWGGTGPKVAPPVSPAQYQLWLLAGSGGRVDSLVSRLATVSSKIRHDPAYDPMVADLGLPSFSKGDWRPGAGDAATGADDPMDLLHRRLRGLREAGQPVPVGAQLAMQVALSFKDAGKEGMAKKYAAWGLDSLDAPPARVEIKGGLT